MAKYIDKDLLKRLLLEKDNPTDIGWVLCILEKLPVVEIDPANIEKN